MYFQSGQYYIQPCIFTFLLHCQTYTHVKKHNKFFLPNLTSLFSKQEVMGVKELTRFKFWSPSFLKQVLSDLSSTAYCPYLFPLQNVLTFYSYYTFFTLGVYKSLGGMQIFAMPILEIFCFKKLKDFSSPPQQHEEFKLEETDKYFLPLLKLTV